jgi:hypothetical protein
MIKTVEYYISELFFLHDCVIIPKFGGFVGNYQSAEVNSTTGFISAPSKKILFNTNLKTNDGLLITHIANQEKISLDEAHRNVDEFARHCNKKLSTSKILRIKEIGLFTLATEGNIIFLQDNTQNYNLASFGLKTTHHNKLFRENKTTEQAKSRVKTVKTVTINYPQIFRAAAVMIPLALISYLSISQQDKITDIYAQMATLNPFSSNENIIPNLQGVTAETNDVIFPSISDNIEDIDNIEYVEDVEDVEDTSILDELDLEDDISTFIPSSTYYIIGGAFSEKKNAYQLLDKISKSNYNAEILDGSSLLRVSYDYFYNREDAILALNKIKLENPRAWLLTK